MLGAEVAGLKKTELALALVSPSSSGGRHGQIRKYVIATWVEEEVGITRELSGQRDLEETTEQKVERRAQARAQSPEGAAKTQQGKTDRGG